MKSIDYKVEGGKLLRLQVSLENEIIKDIKINGDFFVHPEDSIFKIESFLIGKKTKNIDKDLNSFLERENIKIIGFNAHDLKIAIEKIV